MIINLEFLKENNIQLMAYSPLATGRIINDDAIKTMAEKYQKTPAQICIRYCIQKNAIVIPKSTKEERIVSNAQVDFEISKDDMELLENK